MWFPAGPCLTESPVRYRWGMGNKSETGIGTQIILAILILFIAWVVLKWVIRVVVSVAMTVIVLGAILFAAWIFIGRRSSD